MTGSTDHGILVAVSGGGSHLLEFNDNILMDNGNAGMGMGPSTFGGTITLSGNTTLCVEATGNTSNTEYLFDRGMGAPMRMFLLEGGTAGFGMNNTGTLNTVGTILTK